MGSDYISESESGWLPVKRRGSGGCGGCEKTSKGENSLAGGPAPMPSEEALNSSLAAIAAVESLAEGWVMV